MPKQKTRQIAKKRIKLTKKGKKGTKLLKGAVRNSHRSRIDDSSTKHRKKRLTKVKKANRKKVMLMLGK